MGGLDEAERRILVMAVAADSRSGGLDPAKLTMDVTTEDGVMRVRAAYDVSGHPVMMLKGLLPSPPVVIERSAVIRAGGV